MPLIGAMSGTSTLAGFFVLGGLVMLGAQLRAPAVEAPPAASLTEASTAQPAATTLAGGKAVLARAPDSHFYAEALVNGTPVRFLVDTGAGALVLTATDARRAGVGAGDHSARAMGAGGEVRLAPVSLSRLSIGPLAADNVPALVAEDGKIPVSLMGQSLLTRFGTVTIEGDTLTLG